MADLSESGQAGALNKTREPMQGISDARVQCFQSCKNGSPLKWLSFSKGYVEGIFHFVFEYRDTAFDEATGVNGGSFFYSHYYPSSIGVPDLHFANERVASHWKNALMFVSNVEPVEIPKIVLPSWEGLNLGPDEISDRLMGAAPRFYLTVDGSFDAGPIFAEREAAVISRRHPVSFDQNAVCVIKRDPKIVDCIAKHGWRVAGRFSELNASSLFEGALLLLDAETFSVVHNVSPEKRFQLVDVMFGPFYLQ